MSRSVSPTFEAALAETSVKMAGRVTAYKSRIFFKDENINDAEKYGANEFASNDIPLPEAIYWNDLETKYLSVFLDETGQLFLGEIGEVQVRLIGDGQSDPENGISRPGIWENYVFYYDGENWIILEIDMELFGVGDEGCVISRTAIPGLTGMPGAIYPVSATELILFHIDQGAIGVQFVNYDLDQISICPSRFFHPSVVLGADEIPSLHFSGAAKLGNDIFAYITTFEGEVKAVRFSDNNWSDIMTVIPSDISNFKIGNVFTNGTAIFICGAFKRSEEFSADATYTLLTKSTDGFTFSLDRKTLVSLVDFRFLAAFSESGGQIMFSSGNRYCFFSAHYQLIGENAENVITVSNSVIGNPNAGWTIKLKAGGEEYFDSPYMRTGFFSKLEVGVFTGEEYEWITYHETIIQNISKGIKDGGRSMTISILPDAKWHTSAMTHPFYMEMMGKQGIYDPASSLGHLYKLDELTGIEWPFSTDLWSSSESEVAFGPQGHNAATSTDHMTSDLKSKLKDYPVFGALSSYKVKIFGWSRAGKPDTNPNTPDPTDVEGLNDKFFAILEVEDVNGNAVTIISLIGTLSSTYSNPPQTYFEDGIRDGSYPVEFNMANPGEGVKLKRVGVRVISTDVETVYYIERIEIPELTALYETPSNFSGDAPGFQVIETKATWPLIQIINLPVDSNNATNGNKVSSLGLKNGYCYAVVLMGDVEFTSDGEDYLQDAEFVCRADGGIKPTWTRKYPPGIGPTLNPCVQVESTDFPYFSSSNRVVKMGVSTKEIPETTHQYIFKFEDTRFKSSTISNRRIPYVYSNGDAIDISLYLEGTGFPGAIVRGEFKVYVFESPIPFSQFKYYGGFSENGGNVDVISEEELTQTIPTSGSTNLIQYQGEQNTSGTHIFQSLDSWDHVHQVRLNNNTSLIANLSVRTKISWVSTPPAWNGFTGVTIYMGNDPTPRHSLEEMEYIYTATLNPIVSDDYGITVQGSVNNGTPGYDYEYNVEVEVNVLEAIPFYAQVPVPPSFNLALGGDDGSISDIGINNFIETRLKGVPQILFATSPYSAWNFEAVSRFAIKGEDSYAGIVGLANDENNYLVGYFKKDWLGVAKVRGGVRTVVYEMSTVMILEENKAYDIRFWHRDGLLGVDIKLSSDLWTERGGEVSDNGFTIKWTETMGAIATNDDIFHVGIYALIDPPKFRTVGFQSSSKYIPVLPCDLNPLLATSDFIERFAESAGQVDIEGVIYNYQGKNRLMYDNNKPYRGPYQIRNAESWDPPFNDDLNGKTYIGGKAVEITQFQWLNGITNAEDYKDSIIASSSGYSWMLGESQWKVWITTGGDVVWLRNRARHYSTEQPDYYPDGNDRMYITDALSEVDPVNDGAEYSHEFGTFVYRHSDDMISLHGFSAFSGAHDQSLKTLIEKFCKLAGTEANFIGDRLNPSQFVADGGELTL